MNQAFIQEHCSTLAITHRILPDIDMSSTDIENDRQVLRLDETDGNYNEEESPTLPSSDDQYQQEEGISGWIHSGYKAWNEIRLRHNLINLWTIFPKW